MALSVEDIVNEALVAIGWPRPIGDIYEGGPAARAALEIYGQTRDELLQQGDWPFALREVALSANGQTPPSPWGFEYTYPADCLRVRNVRAGPLTGGVRVNNPRPVLYRTWNDQRPNPVVRAILSDQATAVLVYTAKVISPASWEAGFTKALIGELSKKLALRLASALDRIRVQIALAEQAKGEGAAVDDTRGPMLPTMSAAPVAMPTEARR